jgi:phage shock protein PspC (stress-responsive transcriptional regulator)
MTAVKKHTTRQNTVNKLYRSQTDRVIAGVAGGLGEYFKIDSSLIRILFVVITLFGGSGILLYLILWLIIPAREEDEDIRENIKNNFQEIKTQTQSLAMASNFDSRRWAGVILIVIGLVFLLENLGFFAPFLVRKFWPLILVIIGLAIFLKNEKNN